MTEVENVNPTSKRAIGTQLWLGLLAGSMLFLLALAPTVLFFLQTLDATSLAWTGLIVAMIGLIFGLVDGLQPGKWRWFGAISCGFGFAGVILAVIGVAQL